MVKSIALLRVAAYTNGRDAVSEFDCLLLANVLWQRPSEAGVVRDWILERLAQDRGVEQVQYLLAGLFGRACRADGDPEAGSLVYRSIRPFVHRFILSMLMMF